MKLFAVHIALSTLGNVWIHLFFLLLVLGKMARLGSHTDCLGKVTSMEEGKLNPNHLKTDLVSHPVHSRRVGWIYIGHFSVLL